MKDFLGATLQFEKGIEKTVMWYLFSKTYPSFLTIKEGSTSHLGLLPSGKKRETALLGAQNRYALRLADHQRSRHILRVGTAWQRLADTFVSGEKRNHGFHEFTQIWTYASWNYIILVINHRTCYFKSRKNCGIERVVG
jgi:hypothetical protein